MQTKIDFSYLKQFHDCQHTLLWYQWFWLKPLWGQHHNTWNAHTLLHEGAKYRSQAGKTRERTGATIPGRSAISQHAGQRQTHDKREATTISCHSNTSYSTFMALFLGSQLFLWTKQQLNRLQGITKMERCCRAPDSVLSSGVNGTEQIQRTSIAFGVSGHRLTKRSKKR